MVNKNKTDDSRSDEKELGFLKERIVKDIKKEVVKCLRVVLIAVVILGAAALLVFLRLKPRIKDEDEFSKVSKGVIGTGINRDVNQNDEGKETTYISETTTDEEEPKRFFTNEEIYKSVVVIEYGEVKDTNEDTEEYGKEEVNQFIEKGTNVNKESIDYENHNDENLRTTSGIIVSGNEEVYVISYNPDFEKSQNVSVYINGNRVKGTVVNLARDYKLALIKISNEDMSGIESDDMIAIAMASKKEFNSSEEITLIGNQINGKNIVEKGRLTLTENTVSILDAKLRLANTDINSVQNENGFIFNENGILLGIATADDFSGKVSVIDISCLKSFINKMVNDKKIKYIGIYGKEVTDEVIHHIDSEMPYGIYISNTKDDSPAYNAGIMNGDVIVSVAGKEVLGFDDYLSVLNSCQSKQMVKVEVMRKGKEGYKRISYEVTVGELD